MRNSRSAREKLARNAGYSWDENEPLVGRVDLLPLPRWSMRGDTPETNEVIRLKFP
jgi:hypothetical protein